MTSKGPKTEENIRPVLFLEEIAFGNNTDDSYTPKKDVSVVAVSSEVFIYYFPPRHMNVDRHFDFTGKDVFQSDQLK